MVRAILDGRKSVTRRVVTWNQRFPEFLGGVGQEDDLSAWGWFFDGPDHHGYMVLERGMNERHDHGCVSLPCPYGQPGDRLWVRETWCRWYGGMRNGADTANGCEPSGTCGVTYLVDMARKRVENAYWDRIRGHSVLAGFESSHAKWRPSIHMPRWASRLTLEVTEVRVQRLQEISDADVQAEGVSVDGTPKALSPESRRATAWRWLWDSINGRRKGCSWSDNPWVWVISFRKV